MQVFSDEGLENVSDTFSTKHLVIFGARFSYEKSISSELWNGNVSLEKIKILKHRTQNALFVYFGQQFRKTFFMFEVSTLEFFLLLSLMKA